MSDAPQDSHDSLDPDAMAMLRAFRAEEQIPAALHDRVWSRVEGDVARSTRPETRWFRRGAGLGVLVAAAVAVLWIGRQALDASHARPLPSQAGYERDDARRGQAVEPRAPSDEVTTTRRDDARDPALAPAPAPAPAPNDLADEPVVDPPPSAPTGSEPSLRPDADLRGTASERRRVVPAPEPAPGSTLAAENRLLALARAALIDEQPEHALRRLAEHAQRFPQGVLAEERLALRAVALCMAGGKAGREAAGKVAAQAFLREHPQAALAERVRSACLE